MIKKDSQQGRCIRKLNELGLNKEQRKELFYRNYDCVGTEILEIELNRAIKKGLTNDDAYQRIKRNIQHHYYC